MGVLISVVKNLVVIVVIASFLEILLPNNSMRPFVRFTIGLFVILAILNPILSIFYSGRALETQAWDLPWEYNETGGYEETGTEVNRDLQKAGSEVIKEKITQQINSLAILVPGVGDLETQVVMDKEAGELSEVTLVIVPTSAGSDDDGTIEAFSSQEQRNQEQEVINKKLISMMKNLYGLEEHQVVIKFKGG